MKKKSIIFSLIILIFMIFSFKPVKALSPNIEENKVYSCDYTIGGTNSIGEGMIKKYFDSNVFVTKVSSYYLVSITLLNNKSLTDLRMNVSDLESGIDEEVTGKETVYTISLEEEYLEKSIDVLAYVSSMNMAVSFNITLDLSNLVLTDKVFDNTKEYKAVYVPTLTLDSIGDINLVQNSVCVLPNSVARFKDEDVSVSISAISPSGKDVNISNNSFKTEEIGTYTVTYKAECDKYKTNLGNPSYTTVSINVKSSSEDSTIVKINDINSVLPDKYYLITQRITSGNEYDLIALKLEGISENFEITNIKLIDDNSNTISLNDNIEYFIETNPKYNRNEVCVYLYEGEELTQLDCAGYGRYVKFENNKCGTFVVLVKGVEFHMPVWGYIVISLSSVILLIGVVVLVIVIHKKKKTLYK